MARTRLTNRGRTPLLAGARILIVDDDPIVAESLAEFLAREGHETAIAASAAGALETLAEAETSWAAGDAGPPGRRGARTFNLVICDVAMPGMDGLALLRTIGERHPGVVTVMLTAYGTIESAVSAVRAGAADYLTKPVVDQELRISLERALRQQSLLAENRSLRRRLDQQSGLESIVGTDPRMLRIYDLIGTVAASRTTVLMTGETGSGKSLVARAIHQNSPRSGGPFVEVACGSIPETLLESDLFGHVKGAFTGAHTDKPGRLLAADGGTLFLDEINSASPGMQLKLLRALQERRFEPVGSNKTIEVDVRVILASNQPLEGLVASGQFRQDLYYRINVVRIDLPSLRERPDDIPLLAEHFLRVHSGEAGRQITGFTPEAMEALRRYAYPGNVRELSNIVERAVVLSRRGVLTLEDLPPQVSDGGRTPVSTGRDDAASDDAESQGPPLSLADALLVPERRILLNALRANDWNRQATARHLAINRTTLYKKMKLHGLDRLAG